MTGGENKHFNIRLPMSYCSVVVAAGVVLHLLLVLAICII